MFKVELKALLFGHQVTRIQNLAVNLGFMQWLESGRVFCNGMEPNLCITLMAAELHVLILHALKMELLLKLHLIEMKSV